LDIGFVDLKSSGRMSLSDDRITAPAARARLTGHRSAISSRDRFGQIQTEASPKPSGKGSINAASVCSVSARMGRFQPAPAPSPGLVDRTGRSSCPPGSKVPRRDGVIGGDLQPGLRVGDQSARLTTFTMPTISC
jgi:hypothetical protein